MSGARAAVALYVAVALHGLAALSLLLLPTPQSGAGVGQDLGLGLRLQGSDSVLAAPTAAPAAGQLRSPAPAIKPDLGRAARTPPMTPRPAASVEAADDPARRRPSRPATPISAHPAVPPRTSPAADATGTRDAAAAPAPARAGGGGTGGYFAQLRAHLYRFRRDLPGQLPAARARVSFWVSAAGEVSDLRLIESSGLPDLDQASLDLLRRASPLPPPPQGRAARLIVPIEIDP